MNHRRFSQIDILPGGDLLSDLQIILQLQWATKIAFQAAL
jgi:hypothetical protein